MDMIRIVIVDDKAEIRKALSRLLELCEAIEVVGEAGNGKEALEVCKEKNPDVALLDLNMPGISGLDVLEELVSTCSETKVLVITMHDREDYVSKAFENGASGFLLKGGPPGAIKNAIKTVASGKRFLSPELNYKDC